eukprot:ctg_129.g104
MRKHTPPTRYAPAPPHRSLPRSRRPRCEQHALQAARQAGQPQGPVAGLEQRLCQVVSGCEPPAVAAVRAMLQREEADALGEGYGVAGDGRFEVKAHRTAAALLILRHVVHHEHVGAGQGVPRTGQMGMQCLPASKRLGIQAVLISDIGREEFHDGVDVARVPQLKVPLHHRPTEVGSKESGVVDGASRQAYVADECSSRT